MGVPTCSSVCLGLPVPRRSLLSCTIFPADPNSASRSVFTRTELYTEEAQMSTASHVTSS